MAQLEYISEVNKIGSDIEYKTTLLLNGAEIGNFEILQKEKVNENINQRLQIF